MVARRRLAPPKPAMQNKGDVGVQGYIEVDTIRVDKLGMLTPVAQLTSALNELRWKRHIISVERIETHTTADIYQVITAQHSHQPISLEEVQHRMERRMLLSFDWPEGHDTKAAAAACMTVFKEFVLGLTGTTSDQASHHQLPSGETQDA